MVSSWEVQYNDLLFDGSGYGVLSVEGLDPPDSREEVLDRSGAHGGYVFAEFLPPRRVTMEAFISGTDQADFDSKVNSFRSAFIPRLDALPLKFKLGQEVEKRVHCVPVKRAFLLDRDYVLQNYVEVALQFLASDPRIYAESEQVLTLGASGSSNGMSFSHTFSVNFGGGASGLSAVINGGVFASPPFMRLVGPATNPRLRNVTVDKTLLFTGTLASDQFIDIDVLNRTILLNGDPNVSWYGKLDPTSEWWNIEPGSNTIQVLTSSDNPSLTIRFRDAWI